MCGILGLNREDGTLIASAAKSFAYRGPDAFDISVQDGVGFAHNRLSILDVDARANQPMQDESGNFEIVFNGEIYNFEEVKKRLADKYQFRTSSDTEVLLYAYREFGASLTKHLRGMYAFAIHDRLKKKIFIFRDHAGIKPVYYLAQDGICAFASELKGITNLMRGLKREPRLDLVAFQAYWAFGFVPSPWTLVAGVSKLPKSHHLEYDLQSGASMVHPNEMPERDANDNRGLEEIIETRILEHLLADVPVGVFFSGGTDSSLIASVLHAHKIDLQTFSIKMKGKSLDEKSFTEINRLLGLRNKVFAFDKAELEAVYPSVMSRIDEPLADSSLLPTTYLSQQAAKEVKVVLSGEGGDELFLGYHRQVPLVRMGKIVESRMGRSFDKLRMTGGENWQRVMAKLYGVIGDAAGFYLNQMSLLRELTPASVWSEGRKMVEKLGCDAVWIDRELHLENDLLRKIDLATSYASIEGRVPLLDYDVMRGAESCVDTALNSNNLKPFLKAMLAKYLPPELVYRPKSGFGLDADLLNSSEAYRQDLTQAMASLSNMKEMDQEVLAAVKKLAARPTVGFSVVAMVHALENLGLK